MSDDDAVGWRWPGRKASWVPRVDEIRCDRTGSWIMDHDWTGKENTWLDSSSMAGGWAFRLVPEEEMRDERLPYGL